MAPTFHIVSTKTTSWQRQPRQKTPNLRLERRLSDSSPRFQSHSAYAGLGNWRRNKNGMPELETPNLPSHT